MNKRTRLIKKIPDMMDIVKGHKYNQIIGFVPTMGFLHKGHISLIQSAREHNDIVVISIFVNPKQFAPSEDIARYPHNIKRDIEICREQRVDYIFYPGAEEMYPNGFQTAVSLSELTKGLCGKSRPTHFSGVTTVLTKLFNIIQPDNVYFGQKDAQQAVIVNQMIKDLNYPITMHILPIIRENNGIAMSSRNSYLSAGQRKNAEVLNKSLKLAETLIKQGERNCNRLKKIIYNMIENENKNSNANIKIDYIEIVNFDNLQPIESVRINTLIAIAVFIGHTRLIDNTLIKLERIR